MTIWSALGHQLQEPAGLAGKIVGHAMRFLNARPNRLAVAALDIRASDTILELGCGPGHAISLMTRQTTASLIHGVDRSPTMLAQARRRNREAVRNGRVQLHQAAFEALPFPARSIDKILAVNVAYFWRDSGAVLSEMRRVLRPDGAVVIYVTDASSMRQWRFAEPETHHLFDSNELLQVLRLGGFPGEGLTIAPAALPFAITGLIARATQSAPHSVQGAHRS
jgi:ubiquinone/menaquinone biosynthesis C-methylase UbiE